jgi:hypothetical protein
MAAKHHCIICQDLIYSGIYCSECSSQIHRARSIEDEPLDEWLSNARSSRTRIYPDAKEGIRSIDEFLL